MNIPRSILILTASLTLMAGCKKKPAPEPPPMASSAAPVSAPAPAPPEVMEMVRNFERVFFDFDQNALDDSSKAALDENVKIMNNYMDIKLELQGHADERGTTDYNIALGQRRADAVRGYMVKSGIAPSRLTMVSYGEERPAAQGNSETAYSKNRRAEFVIKWGDANGVRGTVGQ